MKKMKRRTSTGCMATGWGTLAVLICSAEKLINTLPGWIVALALTAAAFGAMELGQVLRRGA